MKLLLGMAAIVVVGTAILYFASTIRGQRIQEEPTLITRINPTEEEQIYSGHFRKLYPGDEGKITHLLERAKISNTKEEIGTAIGIPSIPNISGVAPLSGEALIRNLSCGSDSVVVGTVKGKKAHITDDYSFVYTEYEFVIRDVLKDNAQGPIGINDVVRIVRPGGLIKIDEQLIRVEDKSYPPLSDSEKYLVFLTYLPETKGYIATKVDGTFVLSDKEVKQWKGGTPVEDSKRNLDDFYGFVRAASLANCKN